MQKPPELPPLKCPTCTHPIDRHGALGCFWQDEKNDCDCFNSRSALYEKAAKVLQAELMDAKRELSEAARAFDFILLQTTDIVSAEAAKDSREEIKEFLQKLSKGALYVE
jgi:hypothetical protein